MNISRVGVDIAKSVFHVRGVDRHEKPQWRKWARLCRLVRTDPAQHSTGGRECLLGISQRGNSYLRKLLVHGARAVLRFAVRQEDGLSQWIKHLAVRKHRNVAIVALANKTARMAWAVTRYEVPYNPLAAAA